MKKAIGILGGMGPLATADLMRKIVMLTKAGSDREHIRIYVDDNPNIPDRTAAILDGGESPLPQMLDSLKKLTLCGADCIIMPCNTAHYFLPDLQAETQIPFLSMLEATARSCALQYPGKTGAVLATKGTLTSGLYERALEDEKLNYLIPDAQEQDMLMHLIYDVIKAGKTFVPEKPRWENLLDGLRDKGADYFILGCTELPIAAELLGVPGRFVDPTVELAKSAIRFCGYSCI